MRTLTFYSVLLSALFSMALLLATPGQALADRYSTQKYDHRYSGDRSRADRPRTDRSRKDHYRTDRYRYGDYRRWSSHPRHIYPRYTPRYHYYGYPRYSYPGGHYYPRYRHYYRGDNFLGWLAFTAITLVIIDNLNEQQQREHERAMHNALQAPVGETIRWEDNDASGSVTMTREGTGSEGRYCREFTQNVEIGGEAQQVYGTACRNPDSSWEIME